MTNIDWTPERIALLKELWSEGLTASQVAEAMGGMTKNAVLGKLNRLKVPERPARPRVKKLANKAPKVLPWTGQARAPVEQRQKPHQVKDEPAPTWKLVSLEALEAHQCRFPLGEPSTPGFGFCGCRTVPGASYCELHFKRCYVSYTPIRERRWIEVSKRVQEALKREPEAVE